MHFVDDQVGGRDFQRLVAPPVIIDLDDLSPVRKWIAEIRLQAPNGPAGDGTGIGIQQDAIPVKALPILGVIGTVEAIAVFDGFSVQPKNHHGVDVSDAEGLGKRDLQEGFPLTVIVENQRAGGRFL